MVMYDRQTETWWQQFTGIGIVGNYNERVLRQLPSQIVSFAVFAEEYPEGEVLSKKTGSVRPYGNNPYRGYDDIDSTPFLFRDPLDPRLPPMERVLAVAANSADAAEKWMALWYSVRRWPHRLWTRAILPTPDWYRQQPPSSRSWMASPSRLS